MVRYNIWDKRYNMWDKRHNRWVRHNKWDKGKHVARDDLFWVRYKHKMLLMDIE